MSLALSIASTHIISRMRQSLIGVLGIATGVGFSIMMAALMEGSQRDFIAQLVDSLSHITVSDDRRAPPVQPALFAFDDAHIPNLTMPERRRGLKNPLAVMASLDDGTKASIAPSLRTNVLIKQGGQNVGAVLLGIEPRREALVSNLAAKMTVNDLSSLNKAPNAVILGARLAERLGVQAGSTLTMSSANNRSITATVSGLFRTGIAQIDDGLVYTLLRTAQVMAGQSGLVNELRIKLDDALSARTFAAKVEAETGYKAVSWQEANEDLLTAFKVRDTIMYTVVGAILLVASFGTYNIISTIIHEKTRDIAILKSLGLTASLIERIFILEALIIGLIGVLSGAALGNLMTRGLSMVTFKSPIGDATNLPVVFEIRHYLLAGLIALLASFLAAYFPARKAARVNPVEIIRGAS